MQRCGSDCLQDSMRFSERQHDISGLSWDWAVTEAEKKFAMSPPGLRQRFREALGVEFGEPVRAMLDLALHGDPERRIKPLRPTTFVGRLRRALALATLRTLKTLDHRLDQLQATSRRHRRRTSRRHETPVICSMTKTYPRSQAPLERVALNRFHTLLP